MSKKTLVYALSLLIVAGAVGAISASAHGFGFRGGPFLHSDFDRDSSKHAFSQADIAAKIADKVSDGTISQDQADKKLEFMANKQVKHEEHQAELAEFFGLSVEELQAEIESGATIKEIAEAQGIAEEELQEHYKTQMLELTTKKLQQMVDDGQLTQAEADEKLEKISAGDFSGKHHKGFWRHGFKGRFHKVF